MTCGAVVLAAGSSSRLGESKQLLCDEHGETLVHRVAREACEAGARPVCVVVGANSATVRAAVHELDILVAENENWREGMASSIHVGVSALQESAQLSNCHIDGLLILACDMPSVDRLHMQSLMQRFADGAVRVASAYGRTLGIPAIFPHAEFNMLQALPGGGGAKQLLLRADTVPVPLERGTFDLDTPADVAEWRKNRPGQPVDQSDF